MTWVKALSHDMQSNPNALYHGLNASTYFYWRSAQKDFYGQHYRGLQDRRAYWNISQINSHTKFKLGFVVEIISSVSYSAALWGLKKLSVPGMKNIICGYHYGSSNNFSIFIYDAAGVAKGAVLCTDSGGKKYLEIEGNGSTITGKLYTYPGMVLEGQNSISLASITPFDLDTTGLLEEVSGSYAFPVVEYTDLIEYFIEAVPVVPEISIEQLGNLGYEKIDNLNVGQTSDLAVGNV